MCIQPTLHREHTLMVFPCYTVDALDWHSLTGTAQVQLVEQLFEKGIP